MMTLYNNLRVYEDEMKRSSSSTSTSQNLAFLSSENTSSTNEVSTASGDFGVSTAGGISQIDEDDLEELDLRWQVAMLTVRVRKLQSECYNCHRKGHFARECRSGRNQGRRSYGDNGRSNAPTNESSSQALVAQDGLGGYDWSNDFEVEPVNYALMAISSSSSSSSSDNEVQKCSKQCLESFKTLQKNYDSEREKHSRARLEIQGYELALESLESRILVHEKNELAWGEKYEFQNYELKCREIKINNLNLELEKVVKERDELKLKIEKWEESSKNLYELLNSQMSTRDKTSLGYGKQLNELSNNSETDSEISLNVFYVRSSNEENTPANDSFSKVDGFHAVPPPITKNFLTLRADISFAGLDEYAIRNKIIESKTTNLNTKTSETVGKTNEGNTQKPKIVYESVNKDKVIIEDWNSDDEDDVSEVQTVSPVKTNETQTVKTRVDKIGQTSQKQGIGFKKIKACFVCKSTDHLIKDCNFHDKQSQEPKLKTVVNTGPRVDKPVWDNTKRVNHQKFSKYPHLRKTFVPSGVLTRTGLITPVKQNEKRAVHKVSTARLVSTARPVSTVRLFAPKIAQTSGAIRPIYPRMDNVWRPKGNYMDHVSKDSGSFMLKKGNPEILLQDHTVVDSGFSSHMTSNKAYLSDYEDYNGGFVAFGSDLNKGKITGKGKIKTANLDFDDVYFVDELKFNLFSVSQMCDKKNSVLFTETECLILSPSFKLLDESQVVLRAPRKDDVYSLDLKNIVPSGGITCLYANATADESKLWHRRLGHVNFKNINKLVKGHLVRGLPSKVFVNDHTCVACKKGKQHKASFILKDTDVQDTRNCVDKEGQHQKTKDEQVLHDELEKMIAQEVVAKALDDATRQAFEEEKRNIASQKRVAQTTSINKLSTGKSSVSTATTPYVSAASTPIGENAGESSFVYLGGKIPIDASTLPNVDLPIDPNMPDLKDDSDAFSSDGIFNGAYDDENVSAVADFNNMDDTINVNPVPTLKIHKNHPKDQIIGDPKLFLAFASYMGFTVYQMDVKSAFLYGTIEEEVYVYQPPGFVNPAHLNKVYKVIKALYGHHQAPRAWYETLSSFLMENGFRRGVVTSLFESMLVQAHDEEQQQSPSRITSTPSLSQQPTPSSPSPEPIQPTHEAEETASMPHDSPLHNVHSYGSDEGSVQQHDLTILVTKLNNRIDGLEKDLQQTKKTYITALTKLVLREEEVHEKPSDETEVLVQEETPTEIIKEHGSGEKGEMKISTSNIKVSTASPPKVSTVVPHVYTRRSAKDKGNAIMEDHATPKKVKKRTQVHLSIDEELARKMEEEERIRFNAEQEARALQEEEEEERLNLEAARELQRQLDQRQENKLVSMAQARRNMITYLKNQGGYKESYFKRMSYNDIRPIFERVWDYVNTFIPIGSEMEKDSSKPSERETSKTVEEEKVEEEDVNLEPVLIEKKVVGIRRKTLARRRASDKQG
ncbi:ribonuclease H-like domain-containing protein [Tanacetum coccineum]